MRAEFVILIIGMAISAIFTRFISISVFSNTGVPLYLEKWLKHTPTAVFTALIAPAMFVPKGQFDLSIENHYLLAGIATIFLAWRYHNFVLTVGMGTLVIVGLHCLQP